MSRLVFDALVRHQLLIEGLKSERSDALAAILRKVNEDLRNALAVEGFDNLNELNRRRLRELMRSLRDLVRSSIDPFVTEMLRWFEAYVREDVAQFSATYRSFAPNNLPEIDPDKASAAIFLLPIAANGVLLRNFLIAYGLNVGVTVERLIAQARVNNWTRRELDAALSGTRAANFRDGAVARMLRQGTAVNNTIIQHLAAQANVTVARRAFAEYEWVSILDDRTTNICRSRDGKRYVYGEGPVPPAHVGCRSSIVPVIDGQIIPSLTFTEWLRDQPDDIREMRRNGVSRPLTLQQFRAKRSLILNP